MYDFDPSGILVKGKKRNLARDVGIYLSRKLSRQSGKDLGQYFGNISGSAIVVRSTVVAERLQEDKKLKKQIKKIEERIINN
jgi:chromosomal replication initiation ATPase DnaA